MEKKRKKKPYYGSTRARTYSPLKPQPTFPLLPTGKKSNETRGFQLDRDYYLKLGIELIYAGYFGINANDSHKAMEILAFIQENAVGPNRLDLTTYIDRPLKDGSFNLTVTSPDRSKKKNLVDTR